MMALIMCVEGTHFSFLPGELSTLDTWLHTLMANNLKYILMERFLRFRKCWSNFVRTTLKSYFRRLHQGALCVTYDIGNVCLKFCLVNFCNFSISIYLFFLRRVEICEKCVRVRKTHSILFSPVQEMPIAWHRLTIIKWHILSSNPVLIN